jgi:2-succinyl-6-hydroxy-2,4-cyclohexadiene-1-carboxylate synthase
MMWQAVVPYLRDDYRPLAIDLRGHAKSGRPQTGYHIDEMARDVAAVMAHLEIERAHIVGSSLGAEVGLSLAASDPERAISLVCDGALHSEYGPFGTWVGSEAEFKAHVAHTLQKRQNAAERVFTSVDALVDTRRQMFEQMGWWNEHVEAMTRYGACETGDGQITSSWSKQAGLEYMEHYYACRFEEYYRRLTCPVLMISDEEDAQDERIGTVMRKLGALADAEIVVPPGWVHPFGWMLDPEGASKVVLDFLARVQS